LFMSDEVSYPDTKRHYPVKNNCQKER
jgi:hypothetical protein